MQAFSFVIALCADGRRPEKPPHAESLGFSDTLWELVQLCWSESSSARPTAVELSNHLTAAATLPWDPPSVYPIATNVGPTVDDTTHEDSMNSLGDFLVNLIHD